MSNGISKQLIQVPSQISGLTNGQVLFGNPSGGISQSSNLQWNDTTGSISITGNVGIGTVSPVASLDITKVTPTFRFYDTGNNALLEYTTGGGNIHMTNMYSQGSISLGSAGVLDRLWLDKNGKVGIGTTNPASILHTVGSTGLTLENTSGGYFQQMYFSSGAPRFGYYGASAGFQIGYQTTLAGGGWAPTMTLSNTGNVGIGTTSPSSKLHVIGGVRQQNVTDGSDGFLFYNSVGTLMGTLYGFGSSYFAIQAQAGVGRLEFGSYGYFRWMAGAFSNTEVMRLDNSGKLGIGLTSPTASLHIKAGTATAGTAPVKLTSGINLTTPEDGAFEFDGTNLYFTVGGIRKTVTLV